VETGIFLSENRKGNLVSFTRLCVETLQGVLSIVVGIISYIRLGVSMGPFSALSGGVALTLITLPAIRNNRRKPWLSSFLRRLNFCYR